MFFGIASVGLVVRADDDEPEEAVVLSDPVCAAGDDELVHPAQAIARQTRMAATRKPIAFIPENMGLPYLALTFYKNIREKLLPQ
jgi:hypothetical protein